MEETWSTALLLGFLLGMRHALDADHVVAVSTIVSRQRSLLKASLIGAVWGMGHTLTLLVVGLLVVGLRVQIPPAAATSFEGLVGVVLVLLGILTIRDHLKKKVHLHAHRHDETGEHLHFHSHEHGAGHNHGHPPGGRLGWRSFTVGMVHGLAGSAALLLLVLGTVRSAWAGLLYILVFGLGSIAGMLLVGTLIALPFLLARWYRPLDRIVGLAAGLASIVIGQSILWETAAAFGWLRSLGGRG